LLQFEDVLGAHDPFHFGVGLKFVKSAQDSLQQFVALQFSIAARIVKPVRVAFHLQGLVEHRKEPLERGAIPSASAAANPGDLDEPGVVGQPFDPSGREALGSETSLPSTAST